MHEVGLACDIAAIVDQFAATRGIERVQRIDLTVGEYSGVIPEALAIGFESARKEAQSCKDAALAIEPVTGLMHCDGCGEEWHLERVDEPCPQCASLNRHTIRGREFKIRSIEY